MVESATQRGLAAIAGSMPVRNKLVSDQQKAARALQLSQAVAGMAPGAAPTKAAAAEMGAAVATTAGQQAVEAAGKQMEMGGQLGKLGLAEQSQMGAEKLAAGREAARKESLDQTQRLANLDQRAKQELFDKEMQFKVNEANEAEFSERQLMDYAVRNAQKAEDFTNWKQKSQMLHSRNLKILEAVEARLTQAIEQGYLDKENKLNQQQARELAEIKQAFSRRVAEAKARASNTASMWGAAGSLLQVGGAAAMLVPGLQPVGIAATLAGTAAAGYGQREAARQTGEI